VIKAGRAYTSPILRFTLEPCMPSPASHPVLKVLFVSAEISPLAQTGGLGQVCGSLPPALAALGLDMTLVMPLYQSVDRAAHDLRQTDLEFSVILGGRSLPARVWRGDLQGCPVYLLENQELFGRPQLYGGPKGDYPDNCLRFAFLCRGAVELAKALKLEAQVVHCHDWQSALLPAYLATRPFDLGPLQGAASLLTIHNLAYQGRFDSQHFRATGLAPSFNTMAGAEFWGDISFLKAGLVSAGAINAVSPTYAREIQTPQGGQGLDGVLASRSADLYGILNGVDYGVWSPEADPWLPAKYSADDMGGKGACCQALLEAFDLDPAEPGTAVFGFIGRITGQKGVDLIAQAVPAILDKGARLTILGTGEPALEQVLREIASEWPGRMGLKLTYSEKLAHLMQGGSDLMLMPSQFEPCGLNQLYAMRYGSVPLVHATGGLKDTVRPFDPASGQGSGFAFQPYELDGFLGAIRQAMQTWAQPELWQKLMANCMAQDFSWQASAQAYQRLYEKLVMNKPA
jgi:starch synthase